MKSFNKKILRIIFRKIHRFRLKLYSAISETNNITGTPTVNQPTLFEGKGKIVLGNNVNFGFYPSPKFYEGSIYVEARSNEAFIIIGNNTFINNNSTLIADKTSITIGNSVLIGSNVEIIDSDFHNLDPSMRTSHQYECLPVFIENNVFIGNNVKILKGVRIAENSVIGNGSIVVHNIPSNVIAAGVPAKIIKNL